MQTYYDILGVPENASDADIQAAFKSKAREVHPDKVPPGNPYLRKVAAEAFKDLSEAKSVLLDHTERQKYDAGLAYMRGSPASTAPPPPPPPPPASPRPRPAANPRPQHYSPPPPTPPPPPAKKQSFWGPSNTQFGSIVLVMGGIGCLLLLGGIGDTQSTVYPGLTLISLSFALLCWRHGMRPGTDAKVLGGSVFLFIFAAMFFSGWIESPSSNSKPTSQSPRQGATAPAASMNTTPPIPALNEAPTALATQTSQALPPRHSVENDPQITATKDTATGKIVFSEGTSAGSGEPLASPKPAATTVYKTWRNLKDGQTYRTRADGEILYLESTDPYPHRTGDIVSCKFHRAISVGLSWAGECWEQNHKDQSTYKSDATIIALSETRIDMGTGDMTLFAMIPVETAPSGQSQPLPPATSTIGSPSEETRTPQERTPTRQLEISSLTVSERQSIEAACSNAKYLQGPAAYNRCLQSQLATLATVPRRPDLSSLSVSERQSIEAACSNAKYLEGPAAYNRCLLQQLELLKSSR